VKRLLIPAALVAVLAVPATSMAAPTSADKREARAECKALERAAETSKNFVSLVRLETPTSPGKAFSNCRKERRTAAKEERREARSSAVEACRAEHPRESRQRGRGNSAFGQCVASLSRAENREADAEQRERTLNPARACRAEQEASSEDFAKAFGTRSNAFGKCVSQKAQAQQDEEPEAPQQPQG